MTHGVCPPVIHYRTLENATGLSRIQARVLEQHLINVYGIVDRGTVL